MSKSSGSEQKAIREMQLSQIAVVDASSDEPNLIGSAGLAGDAAARRPGLPRWSPAGTITTELLPTLPGHIPPGHHGKPVTPPSLSLSQLDSTVGRYIVDVYMRRVHAEIGH